MTHDPRRDPRAQRADQLARRHGLGVVPPTLTEEDALSIPPQFGPNDRMFESYEQDVDMDPLDWNEEHPLWLAFKKGDVRLATDPQTGELTIVDRRLDLHRSLDDKIPKQKFAKGDVAVLDNMASLAQLQYQLGHQMVVYAIADFAAQGTVTIGGTNFALSPLLEPPVQASLLFPPIGGAILTGELDLGFEGASQHVVFDMLPGEIAKIPFAGQFGRLNARLRPKYYTPTDDAVVVPHLRQYLAFPGGPILTNELWNSLPIQLMAQNGFANPNGAPCQGWISEGFLSNDIQRAPTRRFFGSVKCTGVVNVWHSRCPVAFAATHVMLVGSLYDAANPNLQALSFLMNGPPSTGLAVPQIGPFTTNTLVPLIDNCQSIDVINSPNPVGGVATPEIPFELIYFLSV